MALSFLSFFFSPHGKITFPSALEARRLPFSFPQRSFFSPKRPKPPSLFFPPRGLLFLFFMGCVWRLQESSPFPFFRPGKTVSGFDLYAEKAVASPLRSFPATRPSSFFFFSRTGLIFFLQRKNFFSNNKWPFAWWRREVLCKDADFFFNTTKGNHEKLFSFFPFVHRGRTIWPFSFEWE